MAGKRERGKQYPLSASKTPISWGNFPRTPTTSPTGTVSGNIKKTTVSLLLWTWFFFVTFIFASTNMSHHFSCHWAITSLNSKPPPSSNTKSSYSLPVSHHSSNQWVITRPDIDPCITPPELRHHLSYQWAITPSAVELLYHISYQWAITPSAVELLFHISYQWAITPSAVELLYHISYQWAITPSAVELLFHISYQWAITPSAVELLYHISYQWAITPPAIELYLLLPVSHHPSCRRAITTLAFEPCDHADTCQRSQGLRGHRENEKIRETVFDFMGPRSNLFSKKIVENPVTLSL